MTLMLSLRRICQSYADFDKAFKEWINADPSRLEANLKSDTIIGNQTMCYDAYMVMCDAIEKADSLDGEAIKNALKDINVTEGVIGGAVKFDENGDAEKTTTYILKVVDGAFEFQEAISHEE